MNMRDSGLLTVTDVRNMGLFAPFEGLREIRLGYSVFVEWRGSNTLRFHVPTDPDRSYDFLRSDTRFWRTTEVKFSTAELKFGPRIFFHCPETSIRCLKLVFYKGIVCSKPALSSVIASLGYAPITADDVEARARLLKMGASKRWSKDTRAKIIQRASQLEGLDEALDTKLAKERGRKKRYDQVRYWECRGASTSKALDCGRSILDTHSFDRMLEREDEWFSDPTPAIDPVRSVTAGRLTDYGELDIRVLIDRGWISGDRLAGRSLGWPTDMTEGYQIRMYVRPRDDELHQIIMEIVAPNMSCRYQDIKLLSQRQSERPRYFLCPVERIRSDVLYFRNGIFASRTAHFLRYPPGGKTGVISEIESRVPKISPDR